jgi:hypothetical protein
MVGGDAVALTVPDAFTLPILANVLSDVISSD